MRERRFTARTFAATALAALLLSSCAMLNDTTREPEWVHDEDLDVYFQPDLATDSPDLVEEHFPMLGEVGAVTVQNGQFTDPHGRQVIPGPDDYWWQASIELEPEQVQELIAEAGPTSGTGEQKPPETLTVEEVRAGLIGPLEERLEDCAGDWIDASPALTEPGYAHRTVAGDMITLAAVCEGGTQLVIGARDM